MGPDWVDNLERKDTVVKGWWCWVLLWGFCGIDRKPWVWGSSETFRSWVVLRFPTLPASLIADYNLMTNADLIRWIQWNSWPRIQCFLHNICSGVLSVWSLDAKTKLELCAILHWNSIVKAGRGKPSSSFHFPMAWTCKLSSFERRYFWR